jgi:hypothetical protein
MELGQRIELRVTHYKCVVWPSNAPSKMGLKPRIERGFRLYQRRVLPLYDSSEMAELRGIRPRLSDRQSGVLSLDDNSKILVLLLHDN